MIGLKAGDKRPRDKEEDDAVLPPIEGASLGPLPTIVLETVRALDPSDAEVMPSRLAAQFYQHLLESALQGSNDLPGEAVRFARVMQVPLERAEYHFTAWEMVTDAMVKAVGQWGAQLREGSLSPLALLYFFIDGVFVGLSSREIESYAQLALTRALESPELAAQLMHGWAGLLGDIVTWIETLLPDPEPSMDTFRRMDRLLAFAQARINEPDATQRQVQSIIYIALERAHGLEAGRELLEAWLEYRDQSSADGGPPASAYAPKETRGTKKAKTGGT